MKWNQEKMLHLISSYSIVQSRVRYSSRWNQRGTGRVEVLKSFRNVALEVLVAYIYKNVSIWCIFSVT